MNESVPFTSSLPTEDEVEDFASSRTGLLKNFRIAPCEYKRFALSGTMFGIIGFIYSFMRILKDNYVMSRQDPICILYIKLFYITPLSFLAVLAINYCLTRRSVSKLFSIFSIVFLGIFLMLGTAVIFEKQIMFNSVQLTASLESFSYDTRKLGFLRYIILTLTEPLTTCIYIVAELWGSMILSYLFQSYMNEICTEKQHSRFIPPLFIITNVSLLLSAMVTTLFFKIQEHLTHEQNTLFMGGIFFLQGFLVLMMLFCKHILEVRVLTKPIFISSTVKRSKGPKTTPSFSESLKIMLKSKFLLAMCSVVCFYSVVVNILETVYKNGIKTGADIMNVERGKYSGRFNSYDQYITSISVIILNMSSFSTFVDSHGWLFVGMFTPIIGLISAICILGFGSYNSAAEDESLGILNRIFGGSTQFIFLENWLGMLCLSALKIFKYSAFDVTKERITMRIESRYRPKFKSIYDGIFNKFGKSLGAVYGIILTNLPLDVDFRGISPITSVIMAVVVGSWIAGTVYLGKSFDKSIKANDSIDIDLQESEEKEVETPNQKIVQ